MENYSKKSEQPRTSSSENSIDRRKFLKLLGVMGLSAGATHIVLSNIELIKKKKSKQEEENKNNIQEDEQKNEEEEISQEEEPLEPEKSEYPTHPTAEKVLQAFHKIPDEYFPKDLFTDNLIIALQIQESTYRISALSQAGAVGIMQNTEISLRDGFRYLSYLGRKGIIEYDGPNMDEVSEEEYDDLMKILNKNPEYSRAFGKLYLSQILNQYHIGENDYNQKNIKEAQRMILAAYNAGPTAIKDAGRDEEQWPEETRNYYRKIFHYEKHLANVKSIINKENIAIDRSIKNYFAMKLVLRMNSVESKLGQRSIMAKYLRKLKNKYKKDKKIAHQEIDEFFA
ncbi:MAG: lytic transglycosylase domain-containing protein [Candidatus Moranbacteria bacterium]|nr:lytic transglycosylase domain-containing protein [Candidatus Moranbacteria bacterium]